MQIVQPLLPCGRYFFWLCILCTTELTAQVSVAWGEPEKLTDEDNTLESYVLPDGRIYTIESRQFFNLSVRVTLYDSNGKTLNTKQIKFEKQNKMWAIAGTLHEYINLNEKWYFITDEPLPGKGIITLLAWEFKPESLMLAETPIILAQAEGSIMRQGRFHYVFNDLHTKLYVVEIPGQEKGGMEQWNIKEFDSGLKLINERTAILSYEASKFKVNSIDTDKDGNLIFSCILFKKGGVLAEAFSDDYTIVYAILSTKSNEPAMVPMDFGEIISHHNQHIFQDDGSIYVFGFYSKRNRALAIGIFECTFSLTGKIIDKHISQFPEELIASMHRFNALTTKSEVQYLKMVDVHKNSDGSREFIAEQMLVTEVISVYEGFTTSDTQYRSNDILVFKLDPRKSFSWYLQIPKKQFSTDDGARFLSFRHKFLHDGSIRIVYNDSPSNLLTVSDSPEKMNNKNFCTILATVSPEGKVTKTKLFETKDVGHRMLIKSIRFSDNKISCIAVSKKTFRRGEIETIP
jgi:hypothetical protein